MKVRMEFSAIDALLPVFSSEGDSSSPLDGNPSSSNCEESILIMLKPLSRLKLGIFAHTIASFSLGRSSRPKCSLCIPDLDSEH